MGVSTYTSDLVVVGLGYVGLPLAHEACRSGLQVTGLDVNQRVVDGLNAGKSHIDDLSEQKDLKEFLGHTPIEVLAGSMLGIIIAMVFPVPVA